MTAPRVQDFVALSHVRLRGSGALRAVRRGAPILAALGLIGGVVPAGGAGANGAGTIVFGFATAGGDRVDSVEADGSGGRELVRGGRAEDPAWSPDGARIVLAVRGGLALVNADGTGLVQVTRDARDADPTWSPDATRIAFTRTLRGNQDVYVLGLADGRVTRMTSARARDHEPAWSPDGTTIAFSSRRTGNWELFAMDGDGRRERRLTRTPTAEGFPAWSPDGRTLAFWRRTSAGVRLHVLAGGRTRRVSSGPGNDYDPAWSPDGIRLAFVSDRGGRPQLYVAAADGSAAAPLTAPGGFPSAPAWRPGLR